MIEYKYLVKDISTEILIGSIALFFTAIGIWFGLKVVNKKSAINNDIKEIDKDMIKEFGISSREYEVLELISQGLSNQEIADKLFISLATVKTHSSNLFSKLNVQRRTQAIHKAKEIGLI